MILFLFLPGRAKRFAARDRLHLCRKMSYEGVPTRSFHCKRSLMMKQQRKPRAKRPFEVPKITEARSLDIGVPCSPAQCGD
jgi:hypothetical protein